MSTSTEISSATTTPATDLHADLMEQQKNLADLTLFAADGKPMDDAKYERTIALFKAITEKSKEIQAKLEQEDAAMAALPPAAEKKRKRSWRFWIPFLLNIHIQF